MDKEWTLDRLESIINRWDREEYKNDLPMKGLIAELRQVIAEEKEEGLTTGNE